MQIYINKVKRLYKKTKYELVFSEHGYAVIEKFEDKYDIFKRLSDKPLYKQDKFPHGLIDVNEFIEKGFSLYY